MKRLPAAMIIIDVCHDNIAVREANKLNIPVVAIVDTNGDPEPINYPVVANDDAVKSIKIITDLFVDAIKVAKEVYQKRVVEERAAKEAEKKKEADEKAEKAAAEKTERPARRPRRKAGDEAAAEKEAAQPVVESAAE